MSWTRRHDPSERADRLREAEGATAAVSEQGERVKTQLSLVDRLTEGWRKVHETNHLAKIFSDEGRLG